MLPYYLKSLEILIQHYTVPVALRKSIAVAPDIFKSGLEKLVSKIEAGDSSVDPSMDFAKEQANNISKLKEIGRKNKFIS